MSGDPAAPVMKAMVTVARPAHATPADVREALFTLRGCSVDLVDGWARAAPGAVVAVVSIERAGIGTVPYRHHAWLVDERTQWDGAPAASPGAPMPGIKQVSFLQRAPNMDRQQFAHHWSTHHAALARRHHPALWRYRQNVVIDTVLPGTPDYDGIAELGMRLRLDFRERMYDSDEGRTIVAEDVRRFLDLRRSSQLITREYPV